MIEYLWIFLIIARAGGSSARPIEGRALRQPTKKGGGCGGARGSIATP